MLETFHESESLIPQHHTYFVLKHLSILACTEDMKNQHDELLATIRATAQEQVPFNVRGVRNFLVEAITCTYCCPVPG